MSTKNYIEIFDNTLPMIFANNMLINQDKLKEEYNLQIISQNYINKQREYINEINKSFFKEFSKLYYENILLKNKLAKALREKKDLNQIIIKHEQSISKTDRINGEINSKENDDSNKKEKRIDFYRKRKRKRRKKSEVVCSFNCPFLNCNKSYPSNGSLNMHIKLKHR